MTIPPWVIPAASILVPAIPVAVQRLKRWARQTATDLPPGDPLRRRLEWWSRRYGPLITTVVLWVAGSIVTIVPSIQDGSLTGTEALIWLAAVATGGTTVSTAGWAVARVARTPPR